MRWFQKRCLRLVCLFPFSLSNRLVSPSLPCAIGRWVQLELSIFWLGSIHPSIMQSSLLEDIDAEKGWGLQNTLEGLLQLILGAGQIGVAIGV